MKISPYTKYPFESKPRYSRDPTHFLAGLIRCKVCDATLVQVSSKKGGQFACYNAKWKLCNNQQLLLKKEIAHIIACDLKEKFLGKIEPLVGLEEISAENNLYYVARTSIQALAFLHKKT